MAPKGWLKKFVAMAGEGGEYELKLLAVVSDGVPDDAIHVRLQPFNIGIDGVHRFGAYGLTIYRNPGDITPRALDCHVTLVEDDAGIRNTAELVDTAIQTPAYNNLMGVVASIVSAPYKPLVMIGGDLFQIMARVLTGNKDDVFMQQDFSFLRRLGEFDKPFTLENSKLKATFKFV